MLIQCYYNYQIPFQIYFLKRQNRKKAKAKLIREMDRSRALSNQETSLMMLDSQAGVMPVLERVSCWIYFFNLGKHLWPFFLCQQSKAKVIQYYDILVKCQCIVQTVHTPILINYKLSEIDTCSRTMDKGFRIY